MSKKSKITKPEAEMDVTEEKILKEKLLKELETLKIEMIEEAKLVKKDYEDTPGDVSGSMIVDYDSPYLDDTKVMEGDRWKQLIKPQFVDDFKAAYRKNKKAFKKAYGERKKKK